jgi:hypothetical protein
LNTTALIPSPEAGEGISLFYIPADIVARCERENELHHLRARKQQSANPVRSHHSLDLRPFIMWDGEGPQDSGYSLFGCSEGDEICHPFLGTAECLNLILSVGTRINSAIHIWYGGNYDVSMILKDLSWRHLKRLKDHTSIVWRGFRIEYVPGKWFSVSNGKCRVRIFDVVSFFACPFLDALIKFGIGDKSDIEHISAGKASRSEFLFEHIAEIREYWLTELRLGVVLMNQLRKTFHDAGFNPRSWHGPGALARIALKRHGVHNAMALCPAEVRIASLFAFAGGRFEMPRGGVIDEPIYNADKRSAYPAYARCLPNLAKGRWRYTRTYEGSKFGIYHIDYHASDRERGRIYPLFRRLENGEVVWPSDVEGWYHQPETDLVASDPDARIIEGWVFDEEDETDRPMAWIEEYYRKRVYLKTIGNAAENTFKLIINSVYGQFAQRTGWNRRNGHAPRYHQLEWAGYITSACRAQMYLVARQCGNRLVSIDTDGIYATCSLPVSASTDLGGWDTSIYPSGLFWQSGIYCISDENGDYRTGKTKMRGIPRGTHTFDVLSGSLASGIPVTLKRKMFYGFGLAMNNQYEKLNTWEEQEFTYEFGGKGKRYHNKVRCGEYCTERDKGRHEFLSHPVRPGYSMPHILPWINRQLPNRISHDDLVMFDANHLDNEDRWALDYAA